MSRLVPSPGLPLLWGLLVLGAVAPGGARGLAAQYSLTAAYVVENWQTEDGLPGNTVTSAARTSDGYLWLGTYNGLVRFDGTSFRVFDSSNTPDLPYRQVFNLHRDRLDRLWISFQGGIAIYHQGRFRRLPPSAGWTGDVVRSFSEGPDGTLHVASLNGRFFRVQDDRFEPLATPEGIDPQRGMLLATDAHGTLHGVNAGPRGSFFGRWAEGHWVRLDPGVALAADRCALTVARAGGVWLLCDGRLQRWEEGRRVEERALAEPPLAVWGLHEDSGGSLWVTTYEAGLYRVGPDGVVDRFSTEDVLPNQGVWFVHEDQGRGLWMGTSGGGLVRFVPRRVQTVRVASQRGQETVTSVAALPEGRLAIGTWGQGVFLWETGRLARLSLSPRNQEDVKCLEVDGAGRLWVGTYLEGCWVVERGTPRLAWREGEAGSTVNALFRDRRGRLWALGDRGVTVVEGESRRTIPNPVTPGDKGLMAIAEDPSGHLWAGAANGLYRLESHVFVAVPGLGNAAPREVSALWADASGALWIGSSVQGLARLAQGRLFWYGEAHRLGARSVTGIVEDDGGRLWLATRSGILAVSKSDLEMVAAGRPCRVQATALGVEDGMISQECTGPQQPTIASTPEGRLWFATAKGVASVAPAQLRPDAVQVPVVLDELRFRRKGSAGASSPGDLPGVGEVFREVLAGRPSEPVSLPAGSRLIEIDYAGLAFSHARRVTYETRLLEVQRDWIPVGTRRTAYFPELPPGRYEFQVRALNPDGLPGEAPATLGFVVAAFFWQTAWFRGALLAGLAALGLTAVWSSQGRRLRSAEARVVEEQHRKEELERMVRDRTAQLEAANRELESFSYSVSHDLRAPLRAISGFAHALEEDAAPKLDGTERSHLARVQSSCRQMERLIDGLLRLARVSTAPLDHVAVPLSELAESVLDELQTADPGHPAQWAVQPGLVARGDPDLLRVVLQNLLGNAWKFTRWHPHARIEFTSARADGHTVFHVRDNGAGFDMGQAQRLFGAFQRLHRADEFEGTGVGLATVQRIIARHGGRVWAEARVNEGATFSFTLGEKAE